MKPVRLFMMAKVGDLVNLCKFVTDISLVNDNKRT